MTSEEPDRPGGKRPWRKLRTWLIGVLAAVLVAALTDVATGGISAGIENAWQALAGKSDPAPLTVSAQVQRDRRSAFVFEKPLGALPPPPRDVLSDEPRLVEWVEENGGIDANTTEVRVVIEGRDEASVVLTELVVEVVERRPPPTGTYVEPLGAGGIGTRYFDVDLDESSPTLKLGTLNEGGGPPINFPYRVSRTEPEVFVLFAGTKRCDCRWIAELRWVSGGKEGSTQIRDGDQPFRTASGRAARDALGRDTAGGPSLVPR